MTIKAIFFDFGGVLLRTEFQAPRQHLAERFGLDYDDIDKAVFANESARRATMGEITEDSHWEEILKRFKRPLTEMNLFRDEFFSGDVLDRTLLEYIRSLRGRVHTGLISNAWSGMRDYLVREKIIDVFDSIVISAEVGVMKPDARIFGIALEQANVQPMEAVFVDDILVNIEAAEKVGMKGLLFKDPQLTMDELNGFLEAR